MQEFTYSARFTSDKSGGYVVTFRDIPEAITQGESHEECFHLAPGALRKALSALGKCAEAWVA